MHSIVMNRKRLVLVAVAVGALALSTGSGVIGAGEACAASSGSVSVHFSNASARSAACKANNLKAIYITIADVQGHTSRPHPGWHDLTPGMAPIQVDLLATRPESDEPQYNNIDDCLLVSAGSTNGLPAGKYQQLRVIVDQNGAAPSTNACEADLGAGVFNCVQLDDDSFHALTIPSGPRTGIKIPSTKIARGGLVLKDGQGVDLDIDIDGCRSIVVTGGGRGRRRKPPKGGGSYKLKPVLQAGEVSLNAIISGQVVVGTVGTNGGVSSGTTPVPNASVWLENATKTTAYAEGDPTATNTPVTVNNVVAMTTTDPNGNFVFCPVPATQDDLELVGISPSMPSATKNPSDVTITTGVTVGSNGGMSGLVIPLVEPSSAPTASAQYTTQSNANPPAAISETLGLGMTQSDGTNQAPFQFANDGAVNPVTTDGGNQNCQCPAATDCACVSLAIPPDNPVIGAAGGSYSQASGTGEFSLLAQTPSSGAGSCSPNLLATAPNPASSPLSQPTLSFQSCQ